MLLWDWAQILHTAVNLMLHFSSIFCYLCCISDVQNKHLTRIFLKNAHWHVTLNFFREIDQSLFELYFMSIYIKKVRLSPQNNFKTQNCCKLSILHV